MRDNMATLLEAVADTAGDRVAIVQGDTRRTWRDLDDRAARLAGHLAGRGVGAGDRVAIALRNGPAYVESLLAAVKLRATPVNVNYRYRAGELAQILGDAHATALVMEAGLTGEAARAGAASLRAVVRSGDPPAGADPLADAATGYTEAVTHAPAPRVERSADDEWLMFTGGTTGRPKGVRSSHATLCSIVAPHGYGVRGVEPPAGADGLRETTRRLLDDEATSQTMLVAPPLMHATGQYSALGVLLAAGVVVFTTRPSYDPRELAELAQRHRATDLCLVGDVFARPLAAALEAAADAGRPYDLTALRRMHSVGVTWSPETKRRLLRHCDARLEDVLAASEGGPFARSVTTRRDGRVTSAFELAPGARVVGDDGRDVTAGSGEAGRLAAPVDPGVGYLDDPSSSAATFYAIDGRRYCVPGDLATVNADGTLNLLGRGSRVINTGGEKVFAEEVEEVILGMPRVADALVVGLPDEHWGHRIAAVVAPEPRAALTADEVRAAVAAELATYKKPRDVVFVPQIRRAPSGKADLSWAREVAAGG